MLFLDDGCREEYLCIERIICEADACNYLFFDFFIANYLFFLSAFFLGPYSERNFI